MENLEVSLSCLGFICRHVDRSQRELKHLLSKQIWNHDDRQCILECLAQILLEKEHTLLIARHLRPLVLDLLERSAQRVRAGGRINHDLHERLCVALSRLLGICPDASSFALRYFSSAPPVFQRLFFTNEEASAVQYGPRRMKLRDLMGATLRFLQSDCTRFGSLWDWSPCLSQLQTSDAMVRGYTAQCLALVCHMTDNQKKVFLRKLLTNEEILHMKMLSLEESRHMETEKALLLANQSSVMWHQEPANKFTRGQVVSEDLSPNVVAVCGVVLPTVTPRQNNQLNPKNLVLVGSTCRELRRLALAVASQKPVLIEGPIGCGKTALVEFLAATTGHWKASEIMKVQLGDQTDSKMLLGMYRCTDIPGKFVWQPGTLTQAVTKGQWILLEDIDHAPLDVVSVLLPLMENKKLLIPGRDDCIDVAPGFQFFATRRLCFSGGSWHRPQNSHAALLDKYWTKLQMGNMIREELKTVLVSRYPGLSVVSDRLLDIYCQLTGDRHSDPNTNNLLSPDDSREPLAEDRVSPLEGRALSLRDLLKWCERISVNFDNTSPATAQHVFLEALDCFTAMLSSSSSRLRLAEIIGSKLNISKEKAQHFCQMYQPSIRLSELQASVGRATLQKKQAEAVMLTQYKETFAATRASLVLLEQLAVCVAKGEPVLLVGETGTGKTSTVQHLARVTGHRLRVVNMNQQSDTADLLGGYKPVDHKQLLLPLREAFEDLFSQTYSRKQNLTFLGHVQTCFRGKRWQDLLKLMDHVCKSALTAGLQEKSNAASLQEQWEALSSKLSQTQQQIRTCETAMVFAFVEGTLAQAVKKGHWILLDEINLAAAETLECLSGLLEGSAGSLVLLDRGDTEPLVRHPDFQLFACMNPATDVGKRNLPLGLRNRLTEVYVEELENEGDLRILVSDYLKGLNAPKNVVTGIISFYLNVRKEANTHLVDGTGHRPHYSLRTLCRALKYVAGNPCQSVQRSLYEGFCLSFLTQLDRSSHPRVQKLVCQHVLMGNTKCFKQPIPAPPGRPSVHIEGYWVSQGEMEPALDSSYILTTSVKLNLRDLARVVSAGSHPVLIQGETSVGKTSLIRFLAAATGNQCVRINNHEHTDIQEYIGCYSSDSRGKLVFKEGVLIDAMRKGYWIILDELNLAPTDVLEALNRLLDDNRELFVAETQEVVKAHPRFMLFATQNPPGLYGGRKVLSRAFRNRFVELHFDALPSEELESILHRRCSLPPSYCSKLVKVMLDLQSLRRGSSVFAGKHGFITLRDLFRWADRYRLEEQTEASQDWLQHLANDGYMLLAGRVRRPEEEVTILSTLEKHFKRKVNPEILFCQEQVTSQFSPSVGSVPEGFGHVVWTGGMRRLAVLVGRALRFGESVLLVGETGCGKTTICQMFAALAGQKLYSVNCHLHMETSDFLGGLRPVRHSHQTDVEDGRLFEWHDGPLVLALKGGGVFLMDEISLADDSVLERLNSVLETEKCLVLAEKGSGDDDDVELIKADDAFRLVATMNPGGDFGKKELSPALRNRFTEIWCPQSNSRSDLGQIIHHNLHSGLSLKGGDIAELMLDFIDWLTHQDFGRRCILSVRDVLSWIDFLNAVSEQDEDCLMTTGPVENKEIKCDLKLDSVTAFIHAACLVYIDSIGSGTTVSCADNALLARRLCLGFLQQRLSILTKLDQGMLNALRVYDSRLPRQPQWGEDFFGIDPFYIALGPCPDDCDLVDYTITAGTTAVNAQRLLRALKLRKPVLLEGSPGVGKTSLVAALAKASGNHLVRINLSEQTDVTDLFGMDLPVEGGKGGQFAWRDGPLLAALKAGHWVVLDELNLASQSVLEGLNACFDHRAEIFIPELGLSFQVQHEKTKIFGCQNPFTQGGGRKGLPKSFLNRFTQIQAACRRTMVNFTDHAGGLGNCKSHLLPLFSAVLPDNLKTRSTWMKLCIHTIILLGNGVKSVTITNVFVDQLSSEDMEFIAYSIFPNIDKEILVKMVEFSNRLVQEVCVQRQWGQRGSPWEFNLRDMFRWCQLMQNDQSPGLYNPGQHVGLVYADRMRSEADKSQVLLVFREVFGEDSAPYCGSGHFHITPLSLQVGFSVLPRSGGSSLAPDPPLSITHKALRPLESLMKCVEMGWMAILVGPTGSGKTSLVRLLGLLTGRRLRVMAMNSAMDTTELLGGFEQVDIMRQWQQVLETVGDIIAMVTRRVLMSLEVGIRDTEFLLHTWGLFCQWQKDMSLQSTGETVSSEALNKLEVIIVLLQKLNSKLKVFAGMSKLQRDFTLLRERMAQQEDRRTNGGFEWLDGMLVQALQAGDWLLMDNVNFCSASVLDRLNALLEPNGSLTVSERGVIDGKTPKISPHPNFRLFLTMDPVHGELSRAMRNRGVELFIPAEQEELFWDTLDLKTLLHTAGVTGKCVCNLLIEIHKGVKSAIWDSPASSTASLLHAAALLSSQLHRGLDLPSALQNACGEVYAVCQRTPASQKLAQQVIEQHLGVLDSEVWGGELLCPGVWPDGLPSALLCAEDSSFSTVLRDGQVLLSCLNSLSLQGKRNRPLSLHDLQRALQGSGVHEGLHFPREGGGPEDPLRLLPTAVRLVTERASHGDWILRRSWLSHLVKSFQDSSDPVLVQMEAGNKVLKAAFNSKLGAKGMSLSGILQPHDTDDHRMLVDMRWNKQYLEILVNKFHFEDEDRRTEFLQTLDAVANRMVLMMDREEKSVLCSCALNKSGQNCALRISSAFSKGMVNVAQLPHPVLMHLQTFFQLWDCFVLQAVESGQPNIPEHVMFEILQLFQWRDRFWDVCCSLPADRQGVAVLSLHWQWMHKHLLLRLPPLLLGPSHSSMEGQQELQTLSAAVQAVLSTPVSVTAALKVLQRTQGKVLPFKLESVAECASRLKVLSEVLDVSDLRLESSLAPQNQELLRLQVAGLGFEVKEGLLEALGLILLANNQVDPRKSGVLEKLLLSVELQHNHMTSKGLLESRSRSEVEDPAEGARLSREEVLRLGRRVQLWPLTEVLAVLNQLRLSADLLSMAPAPGDQNQEDCLRRELSRHISFCLQSTPMSVGLLQFFWFLLRSDRLVEALPLVCCQLLSEALAGLWTCSFNSEPDRWLKWEPSTRETQSAPKLQKGPANTGPALLSKAVWSRGMVGVLGADGTRRWEPGGSALLSLFRVTLGEWKGRIQQLQDVSAVLWDNMGMGGLADFRGTDFRLQGAVLQQQLQSMANLLPPNLQEGFMESCKNLVKGPDPLKASQEIQTVFRDFLPPDLLPDGLLRACSACLQQYVQSKTQGSNTMTNAGVFWINMGLLQIKVWTPQTLFDPALKRAYKLSYAQQELVSLEDEWRARNLSSQLMTGSELEESSTTDGFQHPRIRFLWVRMKEVKEQILALSKKQAHRPSDPQYGPLFQELQHYLSSIGRTSAIEQLLSQLLKTLQSSSKSRSSVQALLKEEAVWQNSQQRFCQKLLEDYPLYPDVVEPIRTGILQLRHGMRMVASQVDTALTPVPGLLQLVSCLLAFPSLSPSMPSYLAQADFLCSTCCMDVLRSLMKLLPQQDQSHVIPQSSALLLTALLYLECHALSTGELSREAHGLFRHICQALVNEWDEQQRREKEKEQMEASLYRNRSRLHGSGLTEEEQEEKDFRSRFPQFNKDFADIVSQPTLEGPGDSGLEEGEAQQEPCEAGVISPSVMNEVIAVHQRLCLGYARSLWYHNPTPVNHNKHHIQALVSSYQIASPMLLRFYYLIDSEVDQQLTGSGLMLSALLQNTALSTGDLCGLGVTSEGPYDFYQQPNMSEARLCLPVLEQLSQAVRQRLEDWPEHPALVQLTVVMERILAFSLDSPLAKFLNGLEILLSKAQDWENNASRAVSLRKQLEAVTQLIIQWRKLELNCWSNSLDNAMIRHSQKSRNHWFSIYQLVERYLEDQRMENNAGEKVERLSLSSAASTLQAFIEGSSLGEFHTRLRMLLSFHCHLLLVPNQTGRESLSALLWNLHRYYSQFSESIQARITQLRQPIEKELRDFVKISRWNDVSFWSIKQSVEKTHRTLFKFVKKFEEALNSPSVPSLVEQGSSLNPDDVDCNLEETPLHRVHQALRNTPPGKGKDLHVESEGPEGEADSLQARLPALFRKMKKMCVQLLKKSPVPELTEDFDCFTGEVISNMRELQSLSIDLTADKEKQKAEVKHILQQKQRALSDLFKMLAAIGLSYRKGLTWSRTADSEQTLGMQPLEMKTAMLTGRSQNPAENMLLTELLTAWDGCQKYFYRSWARRTALQTALQHAAKELGVGNIDRCRGFSSHLFKLLLGQRRRLVRITERWVCLRKLTNSIKTIEAQTQTPPEDLGCILPPQDPLQDWVTRSRVLAAQCSALLQQLSSLLHCCPEDGQQREQVCSQPPLSCVSPVAALRQPPGCLMRRGDAVWTELQQLVVEMLKITQNLQQDLGSVDQGGSVLLTWSNFDTCCSAVEQLGGVAAQMSGVEKFFSLSASVGSPVSQPAVTQSLQFIRAQAEAFSADFTAWRTQLLCLGPQHSDDPSGFSSEFSAELEANINTVLCAVQTLVKRSNRDQEKKEKDDAEEEEEEEASVDLLKPGHLTRLLEEELEAELEALSAGEICVRLEKLLHTLRRRRDSCSPQQLQEVNDACRRLLRLHPLLEIYCDMLRYYLTVSVGVHRSTGKLLSVLASIFTELAQKGFCLPQELIPGGDGEGATEFHDYEGGGIGEGEGTKDVSDKIENEDQVEDTSQEGQEKEEQQENGNIKSEENAIEMSEDFDGQMHDGDENDEDKDDESDKEDDEELDKKMGDLGEGQTDTLDERMWGGDEDKDEDGSDKEEESGQGMDQGESELVAKDENLDSAEPNKEKKNEEEQTHEDDREQINEQGDQRDFDENEVDPYHGQQDKAAEPEPMELPENLALGDDEEGGDEEDGENPFDLDDKVMDQEVKEEEPEDGGQGMEENHPEEAQDQEPKAEEEENKEEGGDGAQLKEEEEKEPGEEKEEEKGERDGDAGNKEEAAVPVDKGADPKDEEEGEDEEHPDSDERKEHSADGQTGEDNLQSDAAVEVAGEASQRDQAKEEHGSGAADASQSEGHESKMTARMASQSQTQKKTQSFKRKPGQADEERSTGHYDERINKRLRMVASSEERSERNKPSDRQQESDLHEHVREGEMDYDAQTYDVASLEQQKAMGPQKNPNEDQEDEDVAMETEQLEEELKAAEVQELKPEQLDSSRSSQKGTDSGEMEVQRQREEEEDERRKDRQQAEDEEQAERSSESTIHTVPELLMEATQREERDPEELRKEMELQLEAWSRLGPGTQEEESEAACMWHRYQNLTAALSQQLCEQLRLILEPTQAAKLRGDYRTGKRLNMRKVIPYIASQFRKDKIWLRRTKPSKREYQICLAVDDSSSMVDNHSKQLAFESLSVIINALTLLEVGQVSVCSFGEQTQLLHPLQQQFNDESGARILRLCQFQQKKTRIAQFLETSTKMFLSARQQIPGSFSSETAQLLLIVSDGRGLFLEGKERVTVAVRAAHNANIFVIFVVLDNPNSRDSILDIKVPIFKGPGELPEIRSYMDEFPFPFYVILRDVNALPETLSDALRQWFELVTAADP